MKKIILIILAFIFGFFISGIWDKYQVKNIDLDYSFLDKVILTVDEKFVDTRKDKSDEITDNDKIYGAASGIVAAYGDQHTMFFPPEDSEMFEDDISGEFSGVGMEITNRMGYLTVIAPLPDSPAYNSGIRAKDIISEIDGKSALNMSSGTAVKLIRGKAGTDVNLKVLRKGESDEIEIKITRGLIKIPVVKTFVKDDVFVIKLFTFSENSPELFLDKIIKEFKESKKDKLIIDLRGNTGGYLTAGSFISGLFLEENDLIVTEDYQGRKDNNEWRAGDGYINPSKITNIFKGLKLGILINGGSASASEILAGSLLDHKKAILFGENSFGKGTVQELIKFDNDSSLKVTVAKFILPNGDWISYKGISPDVEIKMEEGEIEKVRENGSYSEYIDNQLQETINYMSKIKSQKDFINKIEDFAKSREDGAKEISKIEKAKEVLKN